MLKTLVCQLLSTISNSLVCCEHELFVKDLLVLVWQHSRDCIMGVDFDVFLYRRNSMSFLYTRKGNSKKILAGWMARVWCGGSGYVTPSHSMLCNGVTP